MRCRSAGGDERDRKEGEAVFADLAEFNSLLSRSSECSTAPFDCRLLNLCCTMSLCTSPNPCAEYRSRVNYICIRWCWLHNPFIHTPQSRAIDMFTAMNPWHRAVTTSIWVAFALCQILWLVQSGKSGKVTKPDDTWPVESSLWCTNLIKKLSNVGNTHWWNVYSSMYFRTMMWYFYLTCVSVLFNLTCLHH